MSALLGIGCGRTHLCSWPKSRDNNMWSKWYVDWCWRMRLQRWYHDTNLKWRQLYRLGLTKLVDRLTFRSVEPWCLVLKSFNDRRWRWVCSLFSRPWSGRMWDDHYWSWWKYCFCQQFKCCWKSQRKGNYNDDRCSYELHVSHKKFPQKCWQKWWQKIKMHFPTCCWRYRLCYNHKQSSTSWNCCYWSFLFRSWILYGCQFLNGFYWWRWQNCWRNYFLPNCAIW